MLETVYVGDNFKMLMMDFGNRYFGDQFLTLKKYTNTMIPPVQNTLVKFVFPYLRWRVHGHNTLTIICA